MDAFKGSHDVGQRLGGGYAGLCLGDPDIGELTISEMSPEDIRAELKRYNIGTSELNTLLHLIIVKDVQYLLLQTVHSIRSIEE